MPMHTPHACLTVQSFYTLAILTKIADSSHALHNWQPLQRQVGSSSAHVMNLLFRKHVKCPRELQSMQRTNRPFFVSTRSHTIQPGSRSPLLLLPNECSWLPASLVLVNGSTSVLRRCITGSVDNCFSLAGSAAATGDFNFGPTVSPAPIDRRFEVGSSDGSNTILALRTRPPRRGASLWCIVIIFFTSMSGEFNLYLVKTLSLNCVHQRIVRCSDP